MGGKLDSAIPLLLDGPHDDAGMTGCVQARLVL